MIQIVFSDIHANYLALETLTRVLEARWGEHNKYWFLGDVFGYGPEPVESWEWVRRHCRGRWALGNHDAWLLEETRLDFNRVAEKSIKHHKSVLEHEGILDEVQEYIRELWEQQINPEVSEEAIDTGLPFFEGEDTLWLFAHGVPYPARERYIGYLYPWADIFIKATVERLERLRKARSLERVVLFVGHTHFPMVLRFDGAQLHFESVRYDQWINLDGGKVWLINPGSVGQPRDGDPRAAYGLFDPERKRVLLGRCAYSVERLKGRYINNAFDEKLAETLIHRLLHPQGGDKFERYQQYYCRPQWDLKFVYQENGAEFEVS